MFEKSRELLDEYSQYLYPIVKFSETVIIKGRGCYVWDADGNKVLDLNSGQFCTIFGHSDPDIADIMHKVSAKIQHTSTATLSDDVLFAAKKIHEICPEMKARTIFLSTGAEANECCLRFAKHLSGNKPGIISFDVGYHGLTHGTESYSMGRRHVKPPVDFAYIVSVPKMYGENDLTDGQIDEHIKEFEKVVESNADKIAAAIFEPIVSSGGMFIPAKKYFKAVREICSHYGIFLIFDECQTGFGRTGTWFYYQQLECVPDFVVCAKGMGLGYPVAAVIFNGHSFPAETPTMVHYSSHQNEPFAGALVSYGIETIRKSNTLSHIKEMGDYLISRLLELSSRHTFIQHPRGVGLMCAFDLNIEASDPSEYLKPGYLFCKRALEFNVMIQPCNWGKTIRLLPCYCVEREDVDYLYRRLDAMLVKYYSMS